MELTDPKMLPHNFSLKGQKFTLYWQETDEKDEFALHADGQPLSQLFFLDPAFKLTDDKVHVFQAMLVLNGKRVTSQVNSGAFEWKHSTLAHKALDAIGEDEITSIGLRQVKHETSVTNETLDALSKFNIKQPGLQKFELGGIQNTMTEKLSQDVVEKFLSICKNLKELSIIDMAEATLDVQLDMLTFATSLIECQAEANKITVLNLSGLCTSNEELDQEEETLINVVLSSGLVSLTQLNLSKN